jgi:hypothetical protein
MDAENADFVYNSLADTADSFNVASIGSVGPVRIPIVHKKISRMWVEEDDHIDRREGVGL